MSIESVVLFGITASIFLSVLAVGMQVAPGDLRYVLSKPSLLIRSLLAMNILGPVVAVLVCRMFSLHPALIVALVTLAIAPVGALFARAMLPLVAPGGAAYARGLFFASTVLSVVLTPLAVEVIDRIFGAHVHVRPLVVAKVVFGSVLLPLGIGLVLGRRRHARSRWVPAINKLSALVLLVCAAVLIVGALPLMVLLFREGTLAAIAIITVIGLAAGHFLGGPDEDDRTVLAFATVSRHPGVAVAVGSLTDQPLAPIGVLVAVLLSEVVIVPYKLWRKRLRAAGPAAPDGA